MNVICAFSSDARELYKADIYRALALPEGHILHFRYKKKYVDPNIISLGKDIKGRKLVIFYTHGNVGADKNIEHISIREAIVVDFEVSGETDVAHIYMRLNGFCNVQIDSINSMEKLPPNKFFSEASCTFVDENNNWQTRINAVKQFLPPLIYFQFKGISSSRWPFSKKNLTLKYANSDRSCFFRLKQGARHTLHLTLGNPDTTTTKINVDEPGRDVSINVVKPIETSVQFDDIDVPMIVQSLQIYKKPSLLTFLPENGAASLGEYATNVELELHGGLVKPGLFGFFSLCVLGAIVAVQPRSPASLWPSWWVIGIAAVLFWGATSVLFYWFNKK